MVSDSGAKSLSTARFWGRLAQHSSRRTGSSARTRRRTTSSFSLEPLESRYVLTDVGGTLAASAVWDLAGSPYNVTSDITVPAGVTLEIQAGVDVQFQNSTGISVAGRLVAEGTAFDRISFDRAPGATRWDGISFADTLEDSRILYADMTFGDAQGEAIHVVESRLLLDNIVWTGTTGTILELEHPSLIVRNSHFPTSNGDEIIHGEHLAGDEYLIIEGNVFANSNNGGDVIDILGADRPGPVMQILNNVFLGGGDDGLDLDGTDAHIEGNLFMNFQLNTTRATTSNAIATGLPQSGETNRTQITVVRNIFMNSDHGILLKEDAFGTIENNVFINMEEAAIQFNEIGGTAVGGPAVGAALKGNIFHNNTMLFQNLVDDGSFRTQLTIDDSLLPNETLDWDGTPVSAHSLGSGNIAGNPLFVDEAGGNLRLLPGSPAIGTGPNGIDMGAYVPQGPSISEVQTDPPSTNNQTFAIAGPGITHYRYRLNNGPYGPVTPVSQHISLSNLANGDYTLDVLGMNDAGEWYAGQTPAYRENTVEIIAPNQVRTGETLPIVLRVRDSHGNVNSLLTTPATLNNAAQLDGTALQVKKGVGSFSPEVTATTDFALTMAGDLADSPTRPVELLDASFPIQTHSGTLTGNTVWDASIEHHITGNVTVAAGSTLTIQPGTRLLFAGNTNLIVQGEITVNGTAAAPVVFNAIDPSAPWGGLSIVNSTGEIHYAFFTGGGADASRIFGHSDSQPMIFVDGSTLDIDNSFIINNVGKAFASRRDAIVNIHQVVISDVDTGAQFDNSIVTATETLIKNIPSGSAAFSDDDNDGFYFAGVHSSGQPSLFQDSFVITTKDDGLDQNGALLKVVRAWIEDVDHEGIASSNTNGVDVVDSIFIGNNQGVEAGYQAPQLTVANSVVFDNDNLTDPGVNQQINAGIRFGDGYNGSNGAYRGHITAYNNVVHDNTDNVRNFDGQIPGPQEGAIDITYSMTNDVDYDHDTGNFRGVPVFGPFYHLLRGSAGLGAGNDGENVGRILPAVSRTFTINDPAPLVRIDEVVAVGSGTDRIELFNGGGSTADLSGMSITNDAAVPAKFVFPAATTLNPGERLVLFADSGSGAGEIHLGFELDEQGDEVLLYNSAASGGTLADSVEFGHQLGGFSIARGADGRWVLSTETLGATNVPTSTAAPINTKINEWLAQGDASFPDDFIEIYNPASLPVDLGGMHLTNNPGTANMFAIRSLTFVDGRGLIVFTADNNTSAGADHLNFTLSPTTGAIVLNDSELSQVDRVDYGPQSAGVSQGRRPNGGVFIDYFATPNPGLDNPGDPDGPNAPTNLVATLVSPTQVNLTWNAIVDPDSSVAYYRVYRDGSELGTTTNTNFSDTTVSAGNTYIYEVAGVDTVDVEGARSTPVSIEVVNVVMFQDGVSPTTSYAGTTDTWLRGSNATTNSGNNERMDADGDSGGSGEWSLIRWNVTAVDAAEMVRSVTVTITVSNPSDDDYGIYALNRNWVENQATWNQYATGSNWQTPGTGASDRGPLLGTLVARSAGTYDVELNAAGVALVQTWIENPASNFGVIIYNPAAGDGLEMWTSERANATQRPKLSIGLAAQDTTGPTALSHSVALDQLNQSISYTFSEEVIAGTGDLRLTNTGTGNIIDSAVMAVASNPGTHTLTWTFPGLDRGVLPDGNYAVSLVTEEIVDQAGNPMASDDNTTFTFAWFRGDVNSNGVIDAEDIDLLWAGANPTNSNPRRDLDADGDVDSDDVDVLIHDIAGTEYGDADLDGAVDGTDLGIVTSSLFQSGLGWAGGDFNFDGHTDVRDFNIWNQNKFASVGLALAAAPSGVPRAALGHQVADFAVPVVSYLSVSPSNVHTSARRLPANLPDSPVRVIDRAVASLNAIPRRAEALASGIYRQATARAARVQAIDTPVEQAAEFEASLVDQALESRL